MDAPDTPSKGRKKGLLAKAKSLIRSSKNLNDDDSTGETDSERGIDPALSPGTPGSNPDQKRLKLRKPGKASLLRDKDPGSPGSLAGQKVRRNSFGALAGPPMGDSKEMQSVNDTEMAVASDKKKKRRKSIGPMEGSKSKAREQRPTGTGEKKRSNSQPRTSIKGMLGKSSSKKNVAGGVEDLMAHLGGEKEDEEDDQKKEPVYSPGGRLRKTVDRNGKIRRFNKKSDDEQSTSDGEHTKRSTSSKKSRSGASVRSASRKGKKSKDGDVRRKRRPQGEDETVCTAPAALQKTRSLRKGDKKSTGSICDSEHSDKSELSEKRSKKKLLKRNVLDSAFDSDASDHSERSERKAKKKSSKRDLLDVSDHSDKSERRKRREKSSERRGGKRLSPKPTKAMSAPVTVTGFEDLDLPFKPGSQDSNLKHTESLTPPGSDKSLDKVEGMVIGTVNEESNQDVKSLNARISELTTENLNAKEELNKLRKEMRDLKLESQRSHTERRELRAELREREFVIKESDMRISALEKAVEAQLDKIEDMEEELRRANEEVFLLEDKLAHMEDVLAESAATEGGGDKIEREMDEKRQQRLERRLEEKEKDLADRENALKEERRLLLKDGQETRSVDQLEHDNRMLLKAMNREKAEAEEKLLEKDAEIQALKTELQRRGGSGDDVAFSPEALGADGGAGALRKKDDQIAFLELELKRLKAELENRDLGDFDKIKRELQAAKNEGQAMKSKYEGAQRRNLILEDEIDHWKSVNCNLEDELAEQKAQVANWRQKYEDAVDVPFDEKDSNDIMDFRMPRAPPSAAQMAMKRDDDSDEDRSVATNGISGLWSKLTTPTGGKRPTVGGTLPTGSLKEVLARSTFH